MKKRISEEEVKNLYLQYGTPEHVIGHCRAVSFVAVKLAEELNKHGYSFDLSLVRGAGLAHDVARTFRLSSRWQVNLSISPSFKALAGQKSMQSLQEPSSMNMHLGPS